VALTFRAELAARGLDIELTVGDSERVAILGPNGAGKSSILAVLAGLLRPDRGRAELAGQVLFDLGRGRGVWRPPHARGIATLAQDPLLFPHLSVLDNVAFGPRSSGTGKAASRLAAGRWLEELGALQFADRRPSQLSGGQAQRVAVARALAAEPSLLLLDEPMAALDVGAAPELRQVLRRVLAARAALIVTHDLLDALVLAHRVVVVDQGTVVESGATAEILRHPRTPFTARIAGLNLVTGTADARGVRQADGQVIEGLARVPLRPGEPAVAVFAPSAVSVFTEPPHGSPRNTLRVTISELEPRDDQVRLRAGTLTGQTFTADVTAPAVSELDLLPGSSVYFSLKASAVTVYPG
jgi:molybdate transport system ATP-binding protein